MSDSDPLKLLREDPDYATNAALAHSMEQLRAVLSVGRDLGNVVQFWGFAAEAAGHLLRLCNDTPGSVDPRRDLPTVVHHCELALGPKVGLPFYTDACIVLVDFRAAPTDNTPLEDAAEIGPAHWLDGYSGRQDVLKCIHAFVSAVARTFALARGATVPSREATLSSIAQVYKLTAALFGILVVAWFDLGVSKWKKR